MPLKGDDLPVDVSGDVLGGWSLNDCGVDRQNGLRRVPPGTA